MFSKHSQRYASGKRQIATLDVQLDTAAEPVVILMKCISTLSSRNSKGLSALHLVEEYPRSNPGVTVSSVKITRLEQWTDSRLVLFKPRRGLRKFIMLTIFGIRSTGLFANGFRPPDQDAFATARGEVFAAAADNASAIYYNPAGTSQLEGFDFRARVYGSHIG